MGFLFAPWEKSTTSEASCAAAVTLSVRSKTKQLMIALVLNTLVYRNIVQPSCSVRTESQGPSTHSTPDSKIALLRRTIKDEYKFALII
jgi:hypothetical protein